MDSSQGDSNQDRPFGMLFTELYRARGAARDDDHRFRVMLYTTFTEMFSRRNGEVAHFLLREAGYSPILRDGSMHAFYDWADFFKNVSIDDLLDSVTHITRFVRAQDGRASAEWIRQVGKALKTRNMAYEVDHSGGIHHLVDAAFQRSRVLTLACLSAAKFHAAQVETEKAFDLLVARPPDNKLAVVNIFLAAENVFKLVAGTGTSLDKASAEKGLRLIAQQLYSSTDGVANQSANRLISSFADWVDACHPYRHGQQDQAVVDPPRELAIAVVSVGADYLRWLVSLGESKPERR